MIRTEHYIRYERVDSVSETLTGITAELHGEELRIDMVRADVVRLMISRAGRLEESPTFAVCVDPLGTHAEFRVEPDADRLRCTPAELVHLLRLLTFSGTHPHLSDGRLLTPEQIVALVLDGALEPALRKDA